jgi:hypothetical protein
MMFSHFRRLVDALRAATPARVTFRSVGGHLQGGVIICLLLESPSQPLRLAISLPEALLQNQLEIQKHADQDRGWHRTPGRKKRIMKKIKKEKERACRKDRHWHRTPGKEKEEHVSLTLKIQIAIS